MCPNGANVPGTSAIGHDDPDGGGSRNHFGSDFAKQGHTWTAELCQKDSDGDGIPNGVELGDDCCRWVDGGAAPEISVLLSNPGDANSKTTRTPCDCSAPSCGGGGSTPSPSPSPTPTPTGSASPGSSATSTPSAPPSPSPQPLEQPQSEPVLHAAAIGGIAAGAAAAALLAFSAVRRAAAVARAPKAAGGDDYDAMEAEFSAGAGSLN